jgi:hypothetical protein
MHLVLDQNFPFQVTGIPWPQALQITPLARLAPHLTKNVDDWQVLDELAHRGDVDGFVTNDADMLNLATEMVVLRDTRLILVVTAQVGHDPLRATGLLMAHLPTILNQPLGKPTIYVLRPGPLTPLSPDTQINKVAGRLGIPPPHLISEERRRIGRSR